MNRNKTERLLLLRQSGEITGRQQRRLDAALAQHPEWLTEAPTVDALKALWSDAAAENTRAPSMGVIHEIERFAVTECRRHTRRASSSMLLFRHAYLMPAYATAAVLILSAIVFFVDLSPRVQQPVYQTVSMDATDAGFETALQQIDTSMLDLLDNFATAENPQEVKLDALVMQLMIMEDS